MNKKDEIIIKIIKLFKSFIFTYIYMNQNIIIVIKIIPNGIPFQIKNPKINYANTLSI